jgi:hypothetical protein
MGPLRRLWALRPTWSLLLAAICCGCTHTLAAVPLPAGQLYVGWATVDITPAARVVLDGSGYKRVSSSRTAR